MASVTDAFGSTALTYDAQGRIVVDAHVISRAGWTAPFTANCAYDAARNRTQSGTAAAPVVATVASTSNQITRTTLSGASQRKFTYAPGGDLSLDKGSGAPELAYAYNAAKRIAGVTRNGGAAGSYGYDFAGRRVWRRTFGSGAAQTAYVFDTGGHLLAEENAVTGAMSKEYVWLDDVLVGMFQVQNGSTVPRYVTTGQIDEPLLITYGNQGVAWSGYSDPYGKLTVLQAPGAILDLRLPGQWFEAEGNALGLHQNGYRGGALVTVFK